MLGRITCQQTSPHCQESLSVEGTSGHQGRESSLGVLRVSGGGSEATTMAVLLKYWGRAKYSGRINSFSPSSGLTRGTAISPSHR